MDPRLKTFLKYKVPLSKIETAREAYSWYSNKWKRDYPDIAMRYSTARRRRPTRPLYSRRRRLTAKRAIVVTPGRSVRRRTRSNYTKNGRIGEKVGLSSCKRVTTIALGSQDVPALMFLPHNVCNLGKGSAINERERDIINCRGFRVRMHIQNLSYYPVTWHMALVAPKEDWNRTGDGFIRGHYGTRDLNIDEVQSGVENNENAVNTDKFVVVKHHRIKIGPSGDPDTTQTSAVNRYNFANVRQNWVYKEYFFKLNRQLRYEDSNANCLTPMYLCTWFDYSGRGAGVAWNTLQTGAKCKMTGDVLMYFREPK